MTPKPNADPPHDAPTSASDVSGVIHVPSAHPARESLDRLDARVRAAGLTVFLRLDQTQEAARVGLTLRPTLLLVFGAPRAGTALMQASETVALDLPLRAVAWEDDRGDRWISYVDPTTLAARHHLPPDLIDAINGIGALVHAAATST
ncbi:DUF302 domain-containing protein [Deinococcus pimensis]|uniref:DUF302 domain-containing protein n=1 Tax=Deinococcus pimensis TaxID=309888 RepID=UPI0004AE5CC0|nr:DUF302 domain-containing protein [Deinococcus pimensis]